MAQLAVSINGRSYQVACDDGQEDHLRELAAHVDKLVAELVTVMGQVGDMRLLVMASLLVVDELFDAREAAGRLRQQVDGEAGGGISESVLAANIEALAERVETIAVRFEQT